MAEWAKHPSYRHAVRLQEGKADRVFVRLARAFARGERVTAHDRGWHAGYLACLDQLLALPQQAAAQKTRKDVT